METTDKSSKKPDTENPLQDSLDSVLDQMEEPNERLLQKQARLLQKLYEQAKNAQRPA
jgi:hypothetical protein